MGWIDDILSGDWEDPIEKDQENDPGSQNDCGSGSDER